MRMLGRLRVHGTWNTRIRFGYMDIEGIRGLRNERYDVCWAARATPWTWGGDCENCGVG